jgi:BirA family biotin operon repressor/biotin-[acetyl-CoA-carboxylase] ligase
VPARHWPWLPLLVGCAVTDALATSAAVDGRLKWPNDVLVGDRKLCGILLERVETDWGPAAVVGIGLNVTTGEDELPVGATSLRLLGARATDRARLLVTLLRTLGAFYTAWQAVDGTPEAGASDDAPFGPGGLRAAYRARCATVDREVRVELAPGRWLAGLARDIDHDGRLVVATTDRDYALGAGEVVHVR